MFDTTVTFEALLTGAGSWEFLSSYLPLDEWENPDDEFWDMELPVYVGFSKVGVARQFRYTDAGLRATLTVRKEDADHHFLVGYTSDIDGLAVIPSYPDYA